MPPRRAAIPGVSIYKPAARSRSRHSWLIYYVEDGRKRTETVSPDYEVTRRYAMKVSDRLERSRLGLITSAERRLVVNRQRTLVDLLDQFIELKKASKITAKEAGSIDSRCRLLISKMESVALDDLCADSVQLAVSALVDDDDLSLETGNKYLKAMKQFAVWLSKTAGFPDEIRFIKPYNVATDIVHARRPLSQEEVDKLLAATTTSGDYQWYTRSISGADRRLIYLLALTSGLRANEIRTLTGGDFRLESIPPTVVVQAVNSKHKQRDEQPLRVDVARAFARHLKGRSMSALVFDLPDKPVEMLRFDLAAAGIEYETYLGFADFHCLRHTYGTMLGRCTSNIKVVQRLMRHSDIRLTQRYMHATLFDDVAAIEGLPQMVADAQAQILRGTGTTGSTTGGGGGAGGGSGPPRKPRSKPQSKAQDKTFPPSAPPFPPVPAPATEAGPASASKSPVISDVLATFPLFPQAPSLRPPKPKVVGSSPTENIANLPEKSGLFDEINPVADAAAAPVSGGGAGNVPADSPPLTRDALVKLHEQLTLLLGVHAARPPVKDDPK